MARMVFGNLPVQDLGRSMAFFERLGFGFNRQSTDETAACLVIEEGSIHAMLLTHAKFREFTSKEVADATRVTEVLTCLSAESREGVDHLADGALAAGGTDARPAMDYGFMYGRSFQDPDAHIWEIIWMDPAHIRPG